MHSIPLGKQYLYFRAHLRTCWQQHAPSQPSPEEERSKEPGPGQPYQVNVSVSSDEEYEALQLAIAFVYEERLPQGLAHVVLVALLKLADRLQGAALAAAAMAAWKGLPHASLPLTLACTLLSSAAHGTWQWVEPLLADCSKRFGEAVHSDPQISEQGTRDATQAALGDALAVANEPSLRALLMALPAPALAYWLHMGGLATDSEGTVLFLAAKAVAAKAVAAKAVKLTHAQLKVLRSGVRMQALSTLHRTCVLPGIAWAAPTLEEVLMLQKWADAGDELRQQMKGDVPAAWVLPPRQASTFCVPDPQLQFDRAALRVAIKTAAATSTPSTIHLRGKPVVRDGIELQMELSGLWRDPLKPEARGTWCGLKASAAQASQAHVVCKGIMVSGVGNIEALSSAFQLTSGCGRDDWWHRPAAGASMTKDESWEPIFAAEGDVVRVVAKNARVTL